MVGRIALIGALLLLGASATAASRNAGTVISVSKVGPSPGVAKVLLATPVTWVNATAVRQRIVWSGGRAPTFVLAPHGRHTLRFAKVGRYPYVVNGSRHGAVVVGTSGSAPGGGGNQGPAWTNWTGHYSTSAASDGGSGYQACSTDWAGSLHFSVKADHSITGSGALAEVAGTAKCALAVDPNRIVSVDYAISGKLAGSTLTLTFVLSAFHGGGGGDGSGLVTHLGYKPTYTLTVDAKGFAKADVSFHYPFGNGGTIRALDTLTVRGS